MSENARRNDREAETDGEEGRQARGRGLVHQYICLFLVLTQKTKRQFDASYNCTGEGGGGKYGGRITRQNKTEKNELTSSEKKSASTPTPRAVA